jgi:hypothetical protein
MRRWDSGLDILIADYDGRSLVRLAHTRRDSIIKEFDNVVVFVIAYVHDGGFTPV